MATKQKSVKQKPVNRKQSAYVDNDDSIPIVASVVEPFDDTGVMDEYLRQEDFEREMEEKAAQKAKRKPSMSSMSTHSNSANKIAPDLLGSSSPTNKPYVKHKDVSFSMHKPSAVKTWPPALRDSIVASFKRLPDEQSGLKFLTRNEWPSGLAGTVFKSCKKIAMRFFIVDDSGSMILNDGKRVIRAGGTCKMVRCTRWSELSESLLFLAEISEAYKVPSEFRLLNGADPVIVGLDEGKESFQFLQEALNESPAGPTPLCTHIASVVAAVTSIAEELKANGQKAAVIIATDGESSDGNVADALRPLTNLPVLVILRLCTEEKQVIEYWDSIDNQLELDIDVLDDQLGDARQVAALNGWMTYGEPIHMLREFGASMKELDIIDESTLSSEQMRVMCSYLFLGGNPRDLPHPGADWGVFRNKIKELNNAHPRVFDTITNTMKPWIDMKQLDKIYALENKGLNKAPGGGGCTIC